MRPLDLKLLKMKAFASLLKDIFFCKSLKLRLIRSHLFIALIAAIMIFTVQVKHISNFIPYFLPIVIFIILFFCYWLAITNARYAIKPISTLITATKKMAKVDLHQDIPIIHSAEWSELTENFNRMLIEINKRLVELNAMAKIDVITRLPNRNQFDELAEKTLALSRRHNRNFALLLLDIDNFKSVNDVYGHDMGDELLKQVALRLCAVTRRSDHIARLGGDEFAIMLCEINESSDARCYAESIIMQCRRPFEIKSYVIKTSVSIGIACYPDAASCIKPLLKYADIALYRAKEMGKNTFQYFAESSNTTGNKHVEIYF